LQAWQFDGQPSFAGIAKFAQKLSLGSNKRVVVPSFLARPLDMLYVLSLLTIVVAAFFSLRTSNSRETKLELSATIPRSAGSVFAVIGEVERVPVWCRQPYWLPNPMRISVMAPWGERSSARKRKTGSGPRGPEEIWIRHLKNREFGYRSIRRHDLSYESKGLSISLS
jgi:hypothetical protein